MRNTKKSKVMSAEEAVAASSLTIKEIEDAETSGDLHPLIDSDGTHRYTVTSLRKLLDELEADDEDEVDDDSDSVDDDYEL